jgi:hypothetical protein
MPTSTSPCVRWVAAGAALALALAGCGGSGDDEQAIKKRVNGFYDAFAAKDAGKICGSITDRQRKALTSPAPGSRAPKSCEQAVRFALVFVGNSLKDAGRAKVTSVQIQGDRAKATVDYRGKKGGVGLAKQNGGWLISDFKLRKL